MVVSLKRTKSTSMDWASLPTELLYLINRELCHLPDYVSFRAVCNSWQISAPISNPPPQPFPWILAESTEYGPYDRLCFFSFLSKKSFTIPLPLQLHGKLCGEPAHDGYLHFYQNSGEEMSLFNPLTNHLVDLPPLDDPSFSYRTLHRRGDYAIVWNGLCGYSKLAFCRLRDKKWTSIECPGYAYCCLCHDGVFFSFDCRTGETRIVDIDTSDLIGVIQSPRPHKEAYVFLIESFGEILWVEMLNFGNGDYWSFQLRHIHFRIYKLKVHLDSGKSNRSWVQTDNIGDCVLFIREKCGVSIKASQFHGSVRNCIYFRRVRNGRSVICRYSIDDGGIEEIPCIFKNWHFFVPTLHYLNS
ncbi:F-box protein skip23 [Rhynchospora pubera]|uniref:F-box protein skip23 n=1 Tax=Rhynchospora pubera TaxID=906938 RepID=A0AAV8EG89_9POAL|nr:F-box protein skip23 [Rhynchospora pubera]